MHNETNLNSDRGFNTPVLLILFNRPKHARQVLEHIRVVKPAQLFVAIDGPRTGVDKDIEGVQQCLDLLDEIDWPCKVVKLIREHNLGCKVAVSQAIDWFFNQVEQGIILEDDCLPDSTFFDFCHTLLKKYASEDKVMHIGGCNLYKGLTWGTDSYFFTSIPHIWGWATWRRAWKQYDVSMKEYAAFEQSGKLNSITSNVGSRRFWKRSFDDVYAGRVDTWDYQWVFTIWRCEGVCITPNQNLVSNIGFDQTATHTTTDSEMANIPTIPMDVKSMRFPDKPELNHEATEFAMGRFFQFPTWWARKFTRLQQLVGVKSL
ncbi:nucleotide-diphospho-sugar transferase [Spirosoma pollinicola]|uniref:Nucleotide-diphospho-sugar transferase n=1 Tax=Spirosoma pollinicola TaxID=2057025 RepID=A0A2K8Z5D1_9BACT|nr:nucleotide-diphospho-sugar transferase [Spirosoma pollinicola]AUD05058.1 nucleotide-diphospho-sugar transferase [Spirosoma pollinicola]